jgi:hypothetical protein
MEFNMVGLNRKQYEKLLRSPYRLPHAPDRPDKYPKNDPEVIRELKARGYDVDANTLKNLRRPMKDGTRRIDVADPRNRSPRWTADAIDALVEILDEEARWLHDAHMCDTLGLTYAAYLEALQLAHREAVDAYGSAARDFLSPAPNADHFTMIVDPPLPRPAKIRFELSPHARKQIERKAKR